MFIIKEVIGCLNALAGSTSFLTQKRMNPDKFTVF